MSQSIEETATDWFLRLRDGTPSPDLRAAFEAWRDSDPRHRAAYARVAELWSDIEELRPAFASDQAMAPDPVLEKRRWWRPSLSRRLAIPAALAASVLAAVLLVRDVAFAPTADHETEVGQQARIDLPDGSVGFLNTDTAIALKYAEGHRRIDLLRGEAWFDVAPNASRPFSVHVLDGASTATGTAFAVRDADDRVTVTVTEGTVRVEPRAMVDGASDGRSLKAGNQVSYDAEGTLGTVRTVDVEAVAAWRRGQIRFDGLPLSDAFAEIDRYRPGTILLIAPFESFDPVTATLSLDSLDQGLEALAATHGLSVYRPAPFLTLVR